MASYHWFGKIKADDPDSLNYDVVPVVVSNFQQDSESHQTNNPELGCSPSKSRGFNPVMETPGFEGENPSICRCLGSIQVSGDVPSLPRVRSRVWAGFKFALREGWVDASPESWIDSMFVLLKERVVL